MVREQCFQLEKEKKNVGNVHKLLFYEVAFFLLKPHFAKFEFITYLQL